MTERDTLASTPPQIVELEQHLGRKRVIFHHVMNDGSVLSDERYASGGGQGFSKHEFRVGDVVKVVKERSVVTKRARHAHGSRIEDHVVSDHVPLGQAAVPVYWENFNPQ